MTNLEGIKFTELACIAIRKCTAGGHKPLLDAFVAAGLIENVVSTIDRLSGHLEAI